jgi:hypothetical protein
MTQTREILEVRLDFCASMTTEMTSLQSHSGIFKLQMLTTFGFFDMYYDPADRYSIHSITSLADECI